MTQLYHFITENNQIGFHTEQQNDSFCKILSGIHCLFTNLQGSACEMIAASFPFKVCSRTLDPDLCLVLYDVYLTNPSINDFIDRFRNDINKINTTMNELEKFHEEIGFYKELSIVQKMKLDFGFTNSYRTNFDIRKFIEFLSDKLKEALADLRKFIEYLETIPANLRINTHESGDRLSFIKELEIHVPEIENKLNLFKDLLTDKQCQLMAYQ